VKLQHVARVHDLTDPACNQVDDLDVEAARARVASGDPARVREIAGSFALLARDGQTVRLARSLDRPLRYFLAKREEGPALVVADRIDTIAAYLLGEGLGDQFHPSYTRMVPAHHVTSIALVGCPDPSPSYLRFVAPAADLLPADLDAIGASYAGALASEIEQWLTRVPAGQPIGVLFSGGVDSGAVFLLTYHLMLRLGLAPARLKAFTLTLGGDDLPQARRFLDELGLGLFLEPIEGDAARLDPLETVRVIEDYKPLDVESATMSLALLRGIRERYPEWKLLVDGDGGDENLKDYPIHENAELTIRSVLGNQFLYQEGWGVGTFKHSLTFSGGQSRSYTRTYAPLRRFGFEGFSPYTRPAVLETAERIPFGELSGGDEERLYALKGEVMARGVRAVTGLSMPVFPKRRFQHGALADREQARLFPYAERDYRRHFQSLFV